MGTPEMATGEALGPALETGTYKLLCSLSTPAKVLSQMPGTSTPTGTKIAPGIFKAAVKYLLQYSRMFLFQIFVMWTFSDLG